MAASKSLELIIDCFTMLSVLFGVTYCMYKLLKYFMVIKPSLYRTLKYEYYRHILIRDVLRVSWNALVTLIYTAALWIALFGLIHYSNQFDIKEFSNHNNRLAIECLHMSIIALIGPLAVKLTKDFIIHAVLFFYVSFRFCNQQYFPSRSDVKLYKQIYELQSPWFIDPSVKSITKTRSEMIDDINQTIDQLIENGRSIPLNHKTINDLTLISFRVGNHSLLNTLELAYVHLHGYSLNHQSISIDWLTKLLKLNGFGEHQKSKQLTYTPVKAVVLD